MHRELLLLGVLRRGNLHGYGINEFIQRDMAFCTDLKKPTAYHLLQKMAEAGWIEERETQDGNRPPRKIYQVTPEGEANFQRLLREQISAHHAAYFDGDIGLAFIEELPVEEAIDLLRQRREKLAETQTSLENVRGHSTGGLQFILEHQKRYLAFEISWLDEVMTRLSHPKQE